MFRAGVKTPTQLYLYRLILIAQMLLIHHVKFNSFYLKLMLAGLQTNWLLYIFKKKIRHGGRTQSLSCLGY